MAQLVVSLPRGRLSLLTRFGVLSLVLVLAIGLVAAEVLHRAIRDRATSDAVRTAVVAARVGLLPDLEVADLQHGSTPLDAARRTHLSQRLDHSVSEDGLASFMLWNPQRWVVHSDKSDLIGRQFPMTHELEDAFAGETVSEVSDHSSHEAAAKHVDGSFLEVYIPLHADAAGNFTTDGSGDVVGAFEIYLPFAPTAAAIAADTHRVQLVLAVGLLALYLASFRLVAGASRTLRRQAAENLHLALHDSLTQLPNRTLFQDRVQQALLYADRHDVGVTVLLIDLDRFKEVNDTLGHHRGDEVLAQIGRRLTGRLRSGDTVARLGGDEFAVLLPDVQTADHARAIAAEIAELIAQPIPVDGFELDIRGSIGVAISPFHGTDADHLLQHADVAMYIAKATHSEIEVYDRALDHYSQERLELAAELREAIDDGQLVLHYQPKVDARTRRTTGVEALLRWDHPQRGRLAPGAFIPVIENTELINPLTDFVLATATAQAAEWRERGWDIPIAVNLSARSVADLSLPGRITRLLAAHGLPASSLELELTESAVLHNPDRAVTVLTELRELGVRLSIDDFGTGYASVAYLTQLPIDAVKIDQQFIQPMLTDGKAASIVRFTLDLARTLQLEVVAEGVEDEETARRLADMGCDLLQGFAICRPVVAGDLELFFVAHAPRHVALVR